LEERSKRKKKKKRKAKKRFSGMIIEKGKRQDLGNDPKEGH